MRKFGNHGRARAAARASRFRDSTTEENAISAAEFFKPDLLIVDVHLREGSGLSAVSTILKKGFIPHIFTTGDRTINGDLSEGAVILQKPFPDTALAQAISTALATVETAG